MPLVAVMLYGSIARGDFSEQSDIDLLGVSPEETATVSKHRFSHNGIITVYSKRLLQDMAAHGDLFVWHLKNEGIAVYDDGQVLEGIFRSFSPKINYEAERRQGAEVGWMLLSSGVPVDSSEAVQAMMYAVRTIAISHLAERGTPAFSRDAVLQNFPDEDLAAIWASKYDSGISDENRNRLRRFLSTHSEWKPQWAETSIGLILNSKRLSAVAFKKAIQLLSRSGKSAEYT